MPFLAITEILFKNEREKKKRKKPGGGREEKMVVISLFCMNGWWLYSCRISLVLVHN